MTESAPNYLSRHDSDKSQQPVMGMDSILAELIRGGENVNPALIDRLDDERLLLGLADLAKTSEISAAEYVWHSNRYSNINRFGPLFDRSRPVTIAASKDNLLFNGSARREETGYLLDLDYVVAQDIDPNLVLYFRVTQLSGEPKPEYYWTSDFSETKNGLRKELGASADTAVILVSTLGEIAKNGGLISDVNDDNGIAVRQVSLATFDQSNALLILNR